MRRTNASWAQLSALACAWFGCAREYVPPVPLCRGCHSIAAAGDFTCARARDNSVVCWGGSYSDGAPVAVPGVRDVAGLAAGLRFACAIDAAGRVYCWGDNSRGQLGDRSLASDGSAVQIPIATAVRVVAGPEYACALLADQTVTCWGFWDDPTRLGPRVVDGIAGATALAAGGNHQCAVTPNGTRCWGMNQQGQLGNGVHHLDIVPPVDVIGSATFVDLNAGLVHTCARDGNDSLHCWGGNSFGQLGSGLDVLFMSTPLDVIGVSNAASVVSSFHAESTCAVLRDGTVSCWGSNDPRVFASSTARSVPTPTTIGGLDDVEDVAVGTEHICARRRDASVYCWGSNAVGQLGNASRVDSASPLRVEGL